MSSDFAVADAGAVPFGKEWIPSPFEMLQAPSPFLVWRDRMLFRSLAAIAARRTLWVSGMEHIAIPNDPFILAPNHSTFQESLLVPSLLCMKRGGRIVHFLADWSFRMFPGVGMVYRRGQVVTVMTKDARPRFLNVLRRFYDDPVPAMERARAHLMAGRSIGIFPEGHVNHDRQRMSVGRVGMARLSLETGVPIVPVGIRFPLCDPDGKVPELASMTIDIGAPMTPPRIAGTPTPSDVRRWHGQVMREIGHRCGKTWGLDGR